VIAVDTSILAYAMNRFAPEHARAAEVVETLANGEEPWGLPWPALHEFLERVCHPHAVARPVRPGTAWTFVEELLRSASVSLLVPTPRHARVMGEVLEFLPRGPALPPGLEVAVVLREHGVRDLLSADRAMRAYRFLSVRDPVHGELWAPGPAATRYRRLSPGRRTGA
jgi:predicted nucleic acid-binding protein